MEIKKEKSLNQIILDNEVKTTALKKVIKGLNLENKKLNINHLKKS